MIIVLGIFSFFLLAAFIIWGKLSFNEANEGARRVEKLKDFLNADYTEQKVMIFNTWKAKDYGKNDKTRAIWVLEDFTIDFFTKEQMEHLFDEYMIINYLEDVSDS